MKENLLNQNFKSDKKNEIWVGDITYIPLQNKYIYLASFLDICTRKVVGWHVSGKIDEELVLKAYSKRKGFKRLNNPYRQRFTVYK